MSSTPTCDNTEGFEDFLERLARGYEIPGHRRSVWLDAIIMVAICLVQGVPK